MTVRLKKDYKLTPKRKAFIQARIDNPKEPISTSVKKAGFNVKNTYSASTLGRNLMQNKNVQMALAEHNELFESAIVGTVKDWKDSEVPRKREIALNAAMFGHDKVHGKATTRIESHSEVVKIAIDLTGSGETPPPDEEIIDLTDLDNSKH